MRPIDTSWPIAYLRPERELTYGSVHEWKVIVKNDPCVYCVLSPNGPRRSEKMTLEHIQPHKHRRELRGLNRWDNLAGADRRCNQERGALPLLMFLVMKYELETMVFPNMTKRERMKARRAVRRGYTSRRWS